MSEKYGFVYIWYDRKHKRYYIGCHWGMEDDGYICSSRWMRKAYNRRPEDFKRRILARIYTNRNDLLLEEHRWLSMTKPEELKIRYYNVYTHLFNHWTVGHPERVKEVLSKMSEASKNISEETRKKMSDAKKGKNLSPATQFSKGQTPWNKNTKGAQIAWNKGKTGLESHVKGRVLSDETRRKISEAQKGKPRQYAIGSKRSEETKRKMSEAQKLRYSSRDK